LVGVGNSASSVCSMPTSASISRDERGGRGGGVGGWGGEGGGGIGGGGGFTGAGPQLIIFHPPGVRTNWDRVTGLAMPGSSSSHSERRRPSLQILYAVDRLTEDTGSSSSHSVRRRPGGLRSVQILYAVDWMTEAIG
jgi:hypothetical protein